MLQPWLESSSNLGNDREGTNAWIHDPSFTIGVPDIEELEEEEEEVSDPDEEELEESTQPLEDNIRSNLGDKRSILKRLKELRTSKTNRTAFSSSS